MSDTLVHLHTATEHFDPDSSLIYCSFRDASTGAVGIGFHGNEENFYVYDTVAPEIWTAFKNADSPGRFYNSYIKGQYPSNVVDVEEIDWLGLEDDDEDLDTPAPVTIQPNTQVRLNDMFGGYERFKGETATVIHPAAWPTDLVNEDYDLYVALDGTNGYEGHNLPVYAYEVSPVEAPRVKATADDEVNPFDADGDRSFEVTVRFYVEEATDEDQALAWLEAKIGGYAEVLFVQEISN